MALTLNDVIDIRCELGRIKLDLKQLFIMVLVGLLLLSPFH